MKNNNFLYGAIVVLVLIVIAVGYTKYAEDNRAAPETIAATEDTTATDELAAPTETTAPAPGEETATTETAEDLATGAAVVEGETADTETAAPAVSEDTPAPSAEEGTAETTGDQSSAEPFSGDESLLAAPAALQMNVADMMADRVLGDVNAPVTIVEYASYTCSHCAHFANDIMPQVKQQLIETGKAKLILREFPLDKIAIKASQLARCAPADKYYDFVEVLFRNQERWLKSDNPESGLKQLGSLAGMDEDTMNACMNNAELETALLQRMSRAQAEAKVASTPTFVFNDGAATITGAQSAEKFAQTVEQLTP